LQNIEWPELAGEKKTCAEIMGEIAVLLPRYQSAKKNCLLNKTQHT
jgi:hypothetical protein